MELIDWVVSGLFLLGGWLLNSHLRAVRAELKRIRWAVEGLHHMEYNRGMPED